MSVSESEAPSVTSFYVARHRDIAVLALFDADMVICAACDMTPIS